MKVRKQTSVSRGSTGVARTSHISVDVSTGAKIAKKLFIYGLAGDSAINKLAAAFEQGRYVSFATLQAARLGLLYYLTLPEGILVGGPLGGAVNHKNIRDLRQQLELLGWQ